MAPLHQKIRVRQNRRLSEHGEEVVEGDDMIQEARGVVIIPNLSKTDIEKGPAHQDAKDENHAAVEFGFSHQGPPGYFL